MVEEFKWEQRFRSKAVERLQTKQPGKRKSWEKSAVMHLLPQWLPLPGDLPLWAAGAMAAQLLWVVLHRGQQPFELPASGKQKLSWWEPVLQQVQGVISLLPTDTGDYLKLKGKMEQRPFDSEHIFIECLLCAGHCGCSWAQVMASGEGSHREMASWAAKKWSRPCSCKNNKTVRQQRAAFDSAQEAAMPCYQKFNLQVEKLLHQGFCWIIIKTNHGTSCKLISFLSVHLLCSTHVWRK